MRLLFLLRGPMGAGKSRWIHQEGLSPYTLSADAIRMMVQNPVYNLEGEPRISQSNDQWVWKLLFQLLEKRLERGDLTLIDATHVRSSTMSVYKKLCQRYRYRCYVVDFTPTPMETALSQNRNRDPHKRVPETVIRQAYEQFRHQRLPGWVTVIQPESFWEVIQEWSRPLDFSNWNKIHHIGHLYGYYDGLMEYVGESLKANELYLFVGNLLGRGLQNAEVLQFFLDHCRQPNIILIEGNHDVDWFKWANGEETRSRMFQNHIESQLEEANPDKKEVRQLYRKFHPLAYYSYHGNMVLVTHGGLPEIPRHLAFVSTEQLIRGFGEYEDDIDHAWADRTPDNQFQIHGYRNPYRHPVEAAARSYNLKAQVESGGLRVVTLTPEGFEAHEIPKDGVTSG